MTLDTYVADVTIRPARPDDRERIVRAFRALDPASVYSRFFSPKKTVRDDELRRLTAGDCGRDVVRVATVGDGSEETIVGIGHCVPDGTSADSAFLVADDYRGLGIAGVLLRHLAEIVRARGVTRLEADVLAGNAAMLRVFRRSGMPALHRADGASVHVTLFLTAGTSEPSATTRVRPKGDLSVTATARAGDSVAAPSVAGPPRPACEPAGDGTTRPGGMNR